MLSNEPRTPRPRPPALIRRSNSTNAYSPSPASIDELPFLSTPMDDIDVSDPVRATAKMLGVQIEPDPELSPTRIAEVSEKSREELANLFLEAEKVIRTREAELAVAANLGKTLLETNQLLKTRHDALLARLPVTHALPATPTSQRTFKMTDGDPWTTDDEIPSASSSPCNTGNDVFKRGHHRRISASPSALQALSETNAELIAELTRLREATEAAQVEGAGRLRKLEREMSALRLELEETQKMNVELEEHLNTQKVEEDRKIEWEERLKMARQTKDHQEPEEKRNFAPSGQGVEAWDSICTTRNSLDKPLNGDSTLSSQYRRGSISPDEYTLVSQLLRKVEELQAANRDIRTRYQVTQEEFARAERNALEIKRMYDTIREEMGADADGEMSDEDYRNTVRPRSRNSLRLSRGTRSPAKSLTPRSSTVSLRAKQSMDEGIATAKPRTRGLGNKHMLKVRKPLTESLFVPPTPNAGRPTPPPTPPANALPNRSLSRSPSPLAIHQWKMPKMRPSLGSELGDSIPDIEASSRAHLKESKKLEESFDEIMVQLGLASPTEKDDDRSSRRERALQRMLTKKEDDMGVGNCDVPSPDDSGQTATKPPHSMMDILRRTSIEALVELWIILQFIIVICFFIYTMTKRGPRDVMGIPPRRR